MNEFKERYAEMFYWDKSDNGFELESQLQTIHNIQEIFIATAFMSFDGVGILQRLIENNAVKKENITICLSAEFSDDRPSEILEKLDKIAMVRIAKSGRHFHPKLYYIKGEAENLLIYGSSNLTSGGYSKNIEFDRICKPSIDELNEVEKFIQYCLAQSDKLTATYIKFYKSQEEQLSELKKIKLKIAKQLKSFEKKDDPFTEDTYNLADFYFNYSDYEVFFSRNIDKYTTELDIRRKAVKEKLLKINEVVEEQVNELNLYVNGDRKHVVSLDYPSLYNGNIVNWMGVRYGKDKDEYRFGYENKSKYESFTKHACLQYVIYPEGFEIDLFFAVQDDAFDRQHLKGILNKFSIKLIIKHKR